MLVAGAGVGDEEEEVVQGGVRGGGGGGGLLKGRTHAPECTLIATARRRPRRETTW